MILCDEQNFLLGFHVTVGGLLSGVCMMEPQISVSKTEDKVEDGTAALCLREGPHCGGYSGGAGGRGG